MKTAVLKKRILAGFMAGLLALFLGAGFPATPAKAASGNVYTCAITPCYQHPVTGEIEDAGGSSSYATGQGMVEGCIYSNGILEVTDSGEYYLTFRMSLMDYTSNHSFLVQNVGDSQWYTPSMGQTGSGTDTNGTTADVCVQVPSENCIVRVSMYVDPMGRDVIFYLYPSNYVAGNSTNMNATMVTEASSAGTSSGSTSTGSTSSGSTSTGTTSGSASTGSSSASTTTPSSSSLTGSTSTGTTGSGTTSSAPALSSSLDGGGLTAASTDDSSSLTGSDSTLDSSEGLSLSTAGDSDTQSTDTAAGGSQTTTILTWVISITLALLVVVGVVAFLVYYFRKNWRRWGGGFDDDDDYDD